MIPGFSSTPGDGAFCWYCRIVHTRYTPTLAMSVDPDAFTIAIRRWNEAGRVNLHADLDEAFEELLTVAHGLGDGGPRRGLPPRRGPRSARVRRHRLVLVTTQQRPPPRAPHRPDDRRTAPIPRISCNPAVRGRGLRMDLPRWVPPPQQAVVRVRGLRQPQSSPSALRPQPRHQDRAPNPEPSERRLNHLLARQRCQWICGTLGARNVVGRRLGSPRRLAVNPSPAVAEARDSSVARFEDVHAAECRLHLQVLAQLDQRFRTMGRFRSLRIAVDRDVVSRGLLMTGPAGTTLIRAFRVRSVARTMARVRSQDGRD